MLDKSGHKPSKMWADKGSKFYKRSMKSWIEKNGIEIYSKNNKGKSVVADKCIRTLKNKSMWLQYQKISILLN